MSYILPQVGTLVFCWIPDNDGVNRWFERTILGHSTFKDHLFEGHILVDSGDEPQDVITTKDFVRKDSSMAELIVCEGNVIFLQ